MSNIIIKRTQNNHDAPLVHNILLEAFEPYKAQYTEGAFNATVVSTENMKQRIAANEFEVLIALCDNDLAGTVSIKMQDEGDLYIASMAVKPAYYGKGIGFKMLEKAEGIALDKHCISLSLETSAPLINAISLYEKFGFERTGKSRDYYGVAIFEMRKNL